MGSLTQSEAGETALGNRACYGQNIIFVFYPHFCVFVASESEEGELRFRGHSRLEPKI